MVASAIPTWTAPAPLCQSATPINLNTLLGGSSTSGGTWTGTGVSGTTFSPAGLNGNITVTYSVGTSPCNATESHTIQVITTAIPTWTAPAPLCQSATPIDLNTLLGGLSTSGGTWTGTGVSGTIFSPAGLNGNINVTYSVGTSPCNATESHTIQILPDMNAAWTAPANSMCNDAAAINLSSLVTGNAGGTWSGQGVSGTQFNPTGLSGAIAVTYSVSGANACPDTVTHIITVIPKPNASWTIPPMICTNQSTFDLNTVVTGSIGGTWSGVGVNSNILDLSSVGASLMVTYTVNNGGCSDSQSGLLHFSVFTADFSLNTYSGIAPLNVYTTNLCQNATSYNWNFGNGETSTAIEPSTTYLYGGTYNVWLVATSAQGCVDSVHKVVVIEESGDFIPNVFTPNGDGLNETFYPVISKVVDSFNMIVYNRWGNKLYDSDSQLDKWDGTYQGKFVPTGVYFYVIAYKFNHKAIRHNGTITVIY